MNKNKKNNHNKASAEKATSTESKKSKITSSGSSVDNQAYKSVRSKVERLPKDKHGRPLTFQNIILNILEYWGNLGCVVAQPYGVEVGAGTSNIHTFFRALGPENYNVIYVEPSRRADDSRYGENPNRMQMYYQMQIIMKPAPQNNISLYLDSLKEIGIDKTKHDLRLVEDNWKAEPLGAWGLGWEVRLDGMEITQYTYFQQFAGLDLPNPCLEITFGLERMAMYIQNVDHYKNILWNDQLTYGDVLADHEYWQSKHNLETSNVQELEKTYKIYEGLASEQIEAGNFFAAYDYVLKMSHLFNLLDARGGISLTDRTSRFKKMGKFSLEIGKLYLQERENKGYPLKSDLKVVEAKDEVFVASDVKDSSSAHGTDANGNNNTKPSSGLNKNLTIIELGLEEMPGGYMQDIVDSGLESKVADLLEQTGLKYKTLKCSLTPRRIVLQISGAIFVDKKNVSWVQEIENTVPYRVFYNDDGTAKPSLSGFLEKNNLQEGDLEVIESKGNLRSFRDRNNKEILYKNKKKYDFDCIIKYMFGQDSDGIIQKQKNTESFFPSARFMKWSRTGETFIRPLRWIYAVHNNSIVNVEVFGVKSSNFTYPPRFVEEKKYIVQSAHSYKKFLEDNEIILDEKQREKFIQKVTFANKKDYDYSPSVREYILQNVYLTESPKVQFVELDRKYEVLPQKVITKVLEDKQQYLVRYNKKTSLVEYGVVANFTSNIDKVVQGNDKVVRARLDDALFYMDQDLKKGLPTREELKKYIFNPKLKVENPSSDYAKYFHTYYAKAVRVEEIAQFIYGKYFVKHTDVNEKIFKQAMKFYKVDRATELVKEFPELEGEVLREYLLKKVDVQPEQNEQNARESKTKTYANTKHKAQINNHIADVLLHAKYPVEEDGAYPKSYEAFIISLAEKIDNLYSIAYTNDLPTGSNDPYEARKHTYSLIYLLLNSTGMNDSLESYTGSISLDVILDFTSDLFFIPDEHKKEIIESLQEFILQRLYVYSKDGDKARNEVILKGIIYSQSFDLKVKYEYIKELSKLEKNNSEQVKVILEVFKRLKNILKDTFESPEEIKYLFQYKKDLFRRIDRNLLQNASEKEVYAFINKNINRVLDIADFVELAELLDKFFVETMVNAKQERIKKNRTILLQTLLAIVIFVFDVFQI